MKIKMQYRLILSYSLLALFIIGLISLLINYSVNRGFENYIIEEHDKLVNEITIGIERSYNSNGFNIYDIEHLGIEAIEKGLIISVYDTSNVIVWSAMEHNAGLCESMITNIRENMFDYYASWNGDYTEDSYTLYDENTSIGKITVGYLGPFYFNEDELYFLSSINQILVLVGLFSLIIAILIGTIISRGLTKPILSIINHLNHIHEPDDSNVPLKILKTKELYDLYEASKRLENRINEQEQLRKQLTQDMAHELKTPLTTIQGQLEAMIDGIFPLTKKRLESSHEEILRIKSLITDIEGLSLLENSNTQLDFQSNNLYDVILGVLSEFDADLTAKDMTFSINYVKPEAQRYFTRYFGDANKLKQLFINLTTNAIKYAGDSSNINIQLDYEAHQLIIHYSDNGNGISDKDAPYIFERFYRADPSRTGHNGLGIGLTLVKSIIERHNGTIRLDQTANKGTHFIITLPKQIGENK